MMWRRLSAHSFIEERTRAPRRWKLTGVDNAGRYKSEVFGNGVSSTRSYFADKQSLQSIATSSGTTVVQNLAYDYDARRDLTSRTDMLQPQDTTERFRYDTVERLTCAYFSVAENDTAPCALGYGYDPSGNGNLTAKSDVGTLVYGDPMHPHAVTGAGSDSFGYDAVGNQIARPAGATLSYTPFDLPKTIAQSTGTVTLAYDGDEQRIRKTTPDAETLYFGDLYERVTTVAPASTAQQYYIHSPERVVAVVTQGGSTPGTIYVHVDHLGSVDVLTNATGSVVENRSYDPFGQRRNPVWGQPPPASFTSMTTVGFTGQESDDELGLVNMKGRVYDPKVGRFLTTDPIVSEPLSGQSWNPYSYVLNNPLNYVDPTGLGPGDLVGEDGVVYGKLPDDRVGPGPGFKLAADLHGPPPPPAKTVEGPPEAAETGATRRPVDVSTTGSSSGHVPQSTAATAVAVTKGIGLGVLRTYWPDPVAYAKALFGVTIRDNTVKGAREDGALGAFAGAVNTFNPFYQISIGVIEVDRKAEAGDTEGATAGGVQLGIGLVATVFGGLAGAEAAPEVPKGPTAREGLAALADLRAQLGLDAGDGTLARLDAGGQSFFGINGHGQQYARPSGVNFQSLRHAEGDVFGQATREGIHGGDATLYVDRPVCVFVFCQSSLQGYIHSLGLDSLTIIESGSSPYTVSPG